MRARTKFISILATATVAVASVAGTAHADPRYGFKADMPPTGSLSTLQAGGHPDVNVALEVARDADTIPILKNGKTYGSTREVESKLPPGLVGNPTGLKTCALTNVVRMMVLSPPSPQNWKACPREAAVGVATIYVRYPYTTYGTGYRTRVWRLPTGPNEAPAFGMSVLANPVKMVASLRSDGDYGISVTGMQLPEPALMNSLDITFWGVPADHQGIGPLWDGSSLFFDSANQTDDNKFGGSLPGAARKPFLSNPGQCTGTPLSMRLGLRSYADPSTQIAEDLGLGAITGCDQLAFEPSIDVEPDSRRAGQPSGYRVDVSVPQTNDADELSTPNLKDAVVTMPKGVALSPTVADGLEACTDAQLGLKSLDRESCPLKSRIGTVDIDSPLVDYPLKGSLYVGEQLSRDPESGEMYRLFLTAAGSGVRIKLRGAVKADKSTGQLTATFADNPQLPFSKLSLHFKGGDRAPLVNPTTCGTHTTTGTLTSWAGHSQGVSSAFAIDQDCPTGRFAPTFTAGTTNPFAGGFSPFTMTVNRSDADQDLSNLKLDLPSGLLGALGSVPLCAEAQAAAGTCGVASRIGSTMVSVGSGDHPFSLPGTVSLAGPYKGAPFSLSVAVPAKAGPFDLGLVVVRAALHVDANNAKASAVSDPFPTIVGGVPVKLRMVNVTLDRRGFMFNATSCEPSTIGGTFGAVGGASSASKVTYQAKSCDQVELQPRLALEYTGKDELRKDRHPGVKAHLGAIFGQSNLKTVEVKLPLTASLDPENAKALCEATDSAAGHCPAESQIGWARATTPSLHEPVQGPVYFVKGTRVSETGRVIKSLPKLFIRLSGEGVSVDLRADSDVDAQNRLVTTFTNIPDVPINDFTLTINNGKHGILKATNDVCGAAKGTTVVYTGHNGGKTQRNLSFTAPGCKTQVVSASNSNNTRLAVRVGGIGAGKVTVSGSRIGKASRSVKSSDAATVRARFSRSTSRLLAQGRKVRVAVKVTYTPKKGKAVTVEKAITVKGKKAARK